MAINKEELKSELRTINQRLTSREDTSLPLTQQKVLIELVNIASPFLSVLCDIAESLGIIAQGRQRE